MDQQEKAAATEEVARALLQRYGVVFWRLLAREAGWLPPWRDLLRVYRRLEARGEIRGGRFVAGFSGEQCALPKAVGLLRETRRRPPSDQWISLSGADPLNLIGILTPGPKLPALTDNRLIYRDGLPVATLSAGGVRTNVTLVFSPAQALLASQAGAEFVSVFVGRADDVGMDGIAIIRQIVELFDRGSVNAKVIAASIRGPKHVVDAGTAGAHIVTAPFKVLMQMMMHPLTDIGLQKFMNDWVTQA